MELQKKFRIRISINYGGGETFVAWVQQDQTKSLAASMEKAGIFDEHIARQIASNHTRVGFGIAAEAVPVCDA
jgi:hypothetical protein